MDWGLPKLLASLPSPMAKPGSHTQPWRASSRSWKTIGRGVVSARRAREARETAQNRFSKLLARESTWRRQVNAAITRVREAHIVNGPHIVSIFRFVCGCCHQGGLCVGLPCKTSPLRHRKEKRHGNPLSRI